MTIIARYTMLNDNDLIRLKAAAPTEMADLLSEFSHVYDAVNLDKYWDGLHFLLTGESASDPIEEDPISEAVVGIFNLNEDRFIAEIPYDELNIIIDALEAVDFSKLEAIFSPKAFDEAEIYPHTWPETDKAHLFKELHTAFNRLFIFYQQAAHQGMNVVVSIY